VREQAQALLSESPLWSQSEISRFQKFVHFWVLVLKSFSRNRCPVRAAGLSYATLLALVPMLAVVMSVTSSFLKTEGEEQIDEFIVRFVANVLPRTMINTNETEAAPATPEGAKKLLPPIAQQEEVVKARKEAARRIHQFIQNTRSGALGVTGSIALIFVAISMLGQIEGMFNDIWGVARGRSRFMRIVLYWGVISLAPLLVAVAVGLAAGPHWQGAERLLRSAPLIGALMFSVMPVVLLCLVFAVFYALMPNTKVHWSAALVGGVVGGLLWHLNNQVSVFYVSRVVSSSKIYGSLGLVPVFMLGLYLSWWILLFGAQVAYAFQNRRTYLEEKQVERIDQRSREIIALRLMARIGQRFLCGQPPLAVSEMGRLLGVPTRLIQQLLQTLCGAGLVHEVAGAEPAYLPARPLETINCHDVLRAARTARGQQLATREEPSRGEVDREFLRIEAAEQQAAAAVTIHALASRLQTPTQARATEPELRSLTE
jgi:membrane protein